MARIDFDPTSSRPPLFRLVVATVVAIVGSLLADAMLVAIGTLLFPATKGYVHFHVRRLCEAHDRGSDRGVRGLADRDPCHLGAAMALLPTRRRRDGGALGP